MSKIKTDHNYRSRSGAFCRFAELGNGEYYVVRYWGYASPRLEGTHKTVPSLHGAVKVMRDWLRYNR